MKRLIVMLIGGLALAVTPAFAQEAQPGPGTVELTVIPGGAMFFTSASNEPSFGNYDLGGAVAYQFSRYVGVEGEVGGTIGITQDLAFGGLTSSGRTPNMLAYSGNVVFSGRMPHAVVPYVTTGIGGLTVYRRTALDVNNTQSFLTGSVGGGIKWYANNRWGLRGDYRFIGVRSAADASSFFGTETRHANRIYGGVLLNVSE